MNILGLLVMIWGADFTVKAGQPDYRPGDSITFEVTLSESSHLYLFGYDLGEKELYLIWPWGKAKPMKPGRWSIPDPSLVFRARESGLEHVIFAFSMAPLELSPRKGVLPFRATMQQLRDTCERIIEFDILVHDAGGQ